MSSTIVFEPRMTMTGGSADRRFVVRQGHLINVAGAITHLVAKEMRASSAIIDQVKGYDPNYLSPFSVEARAAGKERETGGKADDITVIVA